MDMILQENLTDQNLKIFAMFINYIDLFCSFFAHKLQNENRLF